MKPQDKITINNMRLEGYSPAEIAIRLKLSPNTIYSHIRRHPQLPDAIVCGFCGKPVVQANGRKRKKFCSDACRLGWWNSHRDVINKKAYYSLKCTYCGKEFESYGNKKRSFCCRECYIASCRSVQKR